MTVAAQTEIGRKIVRFMFNQCFILLQYISLVFDGTSGLLKTITNLEKNVSIAASQDFWYYVGFNGNNSQAEVQASGAYIFRPLASSARSVRSARISTSKYYVKVHVAIFLRAFVCVDVQSILKMETHGIRGILPYTL